MEHDDAIIQKIKKLNALAERAGSEAEAANAAARVAELLTKHNLDMGAIRMQKDEGIESGAGPLSGRLPLHYAYLGMAVKALFDVEYYAKRTYSGSQYAFVGAKANVEAAVATFGYLVESVENLLKGYKRTNRLAAFDNRGFRLGASKRITEMAHEQKNRIMAQNPGSMELVFIGQAVAKRMLALMNLKTTRQSIGVRDASAYHAGYREGSRVNIHGARNSRLLA